MERRKRKRLPHDVPGWVSPEARYFVTINCRDRGMNTLCAGDTPARLLNGIVKYEQMGRWWVDLVTLMPDHLHMIASFHVEPGMLKSVRAWKGYQRKQLGIRWQSGFFEHRLRTDDEFIEKAHYVRMNPLRQGLVDSCVKWPYTWSRGDWHTEGEEGEP